MRSRTPNEVGFSYVKTITRIAKLKVRDHLWVWGGVALTLVVSNPTRHTKLARAWITEISTAMRSTRPRERLCSRDP